MLKLKQRLASIILGLLERICLDKPYNDKVSRLIDRLGIIHRGEQWK